MQNIPISREQNQWHHHTYKNVYSLLTKLTETVSLLSRACLYSSHTMASAPRPASPTLTRAVDHLIEISSCSHMRLHSTHIHLKSSRFAYVALTPPPHPNLPPLRQTTNSPLVLPDPPTLRFIVKSCYLNRYSGDCSEYIQIQPVCGMKGYSPLSKYSSKFNQCNNRGIKNKLMQGEVLCCRGKQVILMGFSNKLN
ncbi:hypothetical protein RRG08_036435 [Elysia crispata]|uniref:Uncharacterized protein n=1 Tax=Elysia crispata TaxID=231223 RepID=A0AAE1DHF4_9GAST|nr:hypothetical protein RRG08_036435 [Elysia crispata]